MATGICDTGKTILDFADTRHACKLTPSGQGRGNVEVTAAGLIKNGEKQTGFLPEAIGRSSCSNANTTPVEGPC